MDQQKNSSIGEAIKRLRTVPGAELLAGGLVALVLGLLMVVAAGSQVSTRGRGAVTAVFSALIALAGAIGVVIGLVTMLRHSGRPGMYSVLQGTPRPWQVLVCVMAAMLRDPTHPQSAEIAEMQWWASHAGRSLSDSMIPVLASDVRRRNLWRYAQSNASALSFEQKRFVLRAAAHVVVAGQGHLAFDHLKYLRQIGEALGLPRPELDKIGTSHRGQGVTWA